MSEHEKPFSEVRSELRRMGYLDHQVERFLLQDALRSLPPWRSLGLLALKVGLLIGLPSAALGALALAAANGHLRRSAFDVLPLFLHLVPLTVAGLGLAFLAVSGVLAALVRLTHARRIEALSFALAMVSAALSVALALWQGYGFAADLPGWLRMALALLVPALAWTVFKVVHGGLLSLAIRLTAAVPEQPIIRGRWWVGLLVLLSFLVMVPTALEAGRERGLEQPPFLPETAGDRVAVIGVDGVLPQEIDFLIAAGELPAFSHLLAEGGVLATYPRPSVEPITFWATVATGLPAPVHGLESLDTYRPRGVSRPLRRSGWLRHWWRFLAPALVEYRPLLAGQRRAWAFWELASRGGAPSLVVDWWGTFPVEAAPGRLIAHGAFQLLEDEAAGIVHPAEQASALRRRARGSQPPEALLAGLREVAPDADDLAARALSPDVFYRREWSRGLEEVKPRLAALYLPGLDIAADAALGSLAFGEIARWQLREVDALLAELTAGAGTAQSTDAAEPDAAAGGQEDLATESTTTSATTTPVQENPSAFETVVVLLDPGRRGGGEGRVLVWRRAGCHADAALPETTAPAVTSSILRALGLPQSRRLSAPAPFCPWPDPALVVDDFGPREARQTTDYGQEYLESLQSLGYL